MTGRTPTIYALATPPGRGGVAVVRISGPASQGALKSLSQKDSPPARQACVRRLQHPVSRETLDQALVLFFAAPASFTGEDVVELHLHGGMAVVEAVLAALSTVPGLRGAEPGEFTRRAFENDKMDLTAAEAVADLIDAETEAQRMQALDQMGGALARLYGGWGKSLARMLAYVEADIDFPDEDMPENIAETVRPDIEELQKEIESHLDDGRRGERLRNGIHVAVIGAPNVGKSSLVNVLARRDVAIVSDMAGTTRDIVEVHLNLGGYPVILSDTAGLRPDQIGEKGQEGIEAEGIRRALKRAEEADLSLLLFDATALPALDPHTKALIGETSLVAFNKSEKAAGPLPQKVAGQTAYGLSVATGEGVSALLEALIDAVKALLGQRAGPGLTRRRHREALEQCHEALTRALTMGETELLAEDIRLAMRHLGRITGRVDVEDLLDVIFRDFCIGK